MKRGLLMIALCMGMFACGSGNAKSGAEAETLSKNDVVEVLYFHGKQRCATCLAVEKNTKELVETSFSDRLKSGELVFKSVDISENEKLADKYEVSFSSLIVVNHDKSGKEVVEDMTDFAFLNARTKPEDFKKGVAGQIK